MSKIVVPVAMYYNLCNDDVLNLIAFMKKERNNSAHTLEKTNVTPQNIMDFYFKVIVPIVKHDYC